MPCWYFDKSDLKKTASILDGLTPETEARYRREGPRYIFDMGTRLGLHHDTIATAIVFFHRFYVFHSFKKFPRYITATCCLFLAGKVEETPKKCKDLVKAARSLLNDAQFSQFGDDPKEEVMTFERILLQTIKFDLMVEHPYKYMLQYAKALKGEREKIENLVQMAFTFINDSLCTSLSLQWEPQIVAVAVMYLAGRLCKFEPQDWAYNRGRWWDQFIDDISIDLLEDICHQILDLYSSQKASKPGSGKPGASKPSSSKPGSSKPSSSKSKRERPKTPGENEKTEPPTKSSRHDQHTKSKVKTQNPSSSQSKASLQSASSSTNAVNRRNSSNTEVVAMDMEETETENIIIEQNKPISTTTQLKQEKAKAAAQPEAYYGNVNQYQSFIGAPGKTNALGIDHGSAGSQFSAYSSAQTAYPPQNIPGTHSQPHTPIQPSGGRYNAPPMHNKYPHQFVQQSSFDPVPPPAYPPYNDPNAFPPPRHGFGAGYGVTPPPSNPTALATVRITGRRDQQNSNQW